MKHKKWTRNWLAALWLSALMALPAWGGAVVVDDELLAQARSGKAMSYAIFMHDKADLSAAYSMDWSERGHYVMHTLRRTAEQSQAEVRAYLDSQGVDYEAFWIDNIILVNNDASRHTFEGLFELDGIAALRTQADMKQLEPEDMLEAGRGGGAGSNIAHVKAPDAWALGYRGEGMIVGGIDSGVRYTHEALVDNYRGNLGNGSFNHNYAWWDGGGSSAEPVDDNFHGTHTIGSAVGGTGTDVIGVAPDARWIACRGCMGSQCTSNALLQCAEFMAAPWDLNQENPDPDRRPHVVNNSWGDCGRSYNNWYRGVIDAWQAAGIVPVFANGNSSNCGYTAPPGCNTVGNPARYANVIGVGSTGNSNGEYANHSNWGPTDNLWQDNPLGFPSIKPQVSAPGVAIRSATHQGDAAYGASTGTSMSAPHVAGLVALLWEAAPCLVGDYASTVEIMMSSALEIPYPSQCGGEGPGDLPNNATGWGEMDAFASVAAGMALCGAQKIEGVITRIDTGHPVEGVEIRLAGPLTRVVHTDTAGVYEQGLPPGSYTLTAYKSGFGIQTVSDVTVLSGETETVDLVLDLAPASAIETHGLWYEVMQDAQQDQSLSIANTGNANLDWNVSLDVPAGVDDPRSYDPLLDETFTLADFQLGSIASGGTEVAFTVTGGQATRGRVTGFSFSGRVSGISGQPVWASTTCLVIESPLGARYGVGGSDGLLPGCAAHDWSFQGPGSSNDGTYNSVHEQVFMPAVGDAGTWTLTLINDWNNTLSTPIDWSDVSVTLHKTTLPVCDGIREVPWLDVSPLSGSVAPAGSEEVLVTVDATGLTPGIHESALCIHTNDEKAPVVPVPVTLTVEPLPPGTLGVEPAVVNFGTVPVGHSTVLGFTIHNLASSGPSLLELVGIELVSGAALEVMSGGCQTGTALPTGASCTVEVRFAPMAVGAEIGTILIEADDNPPFTVTLFGTGGEAPDQLFHDRFEPAGP